MSLFKEPPTDLDKPIESAVAAEIREIARRKADSESVTDSFSTLVQSVAGGPAEIDRLMAEMHTLRDLLQAESARVEREIIEYAHLSQSAMQTTKIITESLAMWRGGIKARGRADSGRGTTDNTIASLS